MERRGLLSEIKIEFDENGKREPGGVPRRSVKMVHTRGFTKKWEKPPKSEKKVPRPRWGIVIGE